MKNREILFRGISASERKFVYGAYYKGRENTYILFQKAPCEKDNQGLHPYKPCEIIPETVGQFTGLLDKNGKRIFEGDICRDRVGDIIVRWDTENARFLGFYSDSVERDTRICYVGREPSVEIIGTIHDHLLSNNND